MEKKQAVVLYDGECNLCNAVVQFTIVRDRGDRLRYAAQQSEAGQRLLAEHGLSEDALDTFVLVEGDRAYARSEGALRLMKYMSGGWRLLSALRIVPRPLRDPIYTFVARNRYRWFGRSERCMLMRPEFRDKFLT